MNMIKNFGMDINYFFDFGFWQMGDEMFGWSYDGELSLVCYVVFVYLMVVFQSFFNWISGRIVVVCSIDFFNVVDERVRKFVFFVDVYVYFVCF